MSEEALPANPLGGRTLVVDRADRHCYPTPSAALKDVGESDVYIRPGIYEDKLVVTQRPMRLIDAGRDRVQIFYRRGGQLYLQEVPEGWITGITFRYVGSDQHSALNILNSTCLITQWLVKIELAGVRWFSERQYGLEFISVRPDMLMKPRLSLCC